MAEVNVQKKGTSFDKTDLYGDRHKRMSPLFYLWGKRYLHWLDNSPDIAVCEKEVLFRRRFYRFLQKIGPSVLKCTQVIENRKTLCNLVSAQTEIPVQLPDKPVIFAANHGFHDDILATVLAARRHAYLVWGSLPLLYNTIDGVAVSLVGTICVNRNDKKSRSALLGKALQALEYGADLIIFPEGTWNRTPNKPLLDFRKGVYTISAAAQAEVIPIVHYVRDMEILNKKNIIHTVVDDPVPLYSYPQKEALAMLREIMATWYFRMEEVYGQSSREVEMAGMNTSNERWEQLLKARLAPVLRLDSRVERRSDFRPRDRVMPEDVWEAVARVENVTAANVKHVLYARKLVEEQRLNDYQHRF